MVVFLIDPVKQINKGKDAQRREDFKQIRNALDTYYNDFSCYPADIPFGQEWRVNNTVYMKKVPQDPNCSSNSSCYQYVYDESALCPQWNVLFGRLVITPSSSAPACQLQNECLPLNYEQEYNMCDFGGNIDCDYLAGSAMEAPAPPVAPTPTTMPSSSAPTPDASSGLYLCACGAHHKTVCNITYNPPINVQYYTDASCNNQCGLPC